ncbi:MAG: DUF3987 domain-containing protein [Nitrosomonas sp.]|nr:DUF3987 domain-containing protein [Nitrosomonas sp.]
MNLRQKAEAAIALIEPNALTPEPLPELPEVKPFDYFFLPASIRGYVQDISERMQCPPDFAAVNTYLMFSAVIGCKIGIRPKRRDNWVIVPNLWGAVIGGSGVMKSPNRSEVLKPLKQLQIEIAQEIHQRNTQLMNSGEESKLRQAAKKSQARKALKNDPNADISEFLKSGSDALPQAETAPRFITHDATAEALGQLMIENPNGILFEADELIGLLKSLDKQGQEGARAFYLTAADGNPTQSIESCEAPIYISKSLAYRSLEGYSRAYWLNT